MPAIATRRPLTFRMRAMSALALAVGVALTAAPGWAGTSEPRTSHTAIAPPAGMTIPGVAPIQSRPFGKSYSQWAAAWWQWAVQTPAANHPALGGPCSSGQSGSVWFVGVNFAGGERSSSCTVPTGTALYLQLISSVLFAFLNDPPEQRTEEFLRAFVECTNFSAQSLRIDGIEYRGAAARYLERSIVFSAQLPVDNVFGLTQDQVPQLLLSPAADMGYYLFVNPLSVGSHLVEWQVSMVCPNLGGTITQQQSLTITVVPKKSS
jgi:hypothetical protein